MVDPDLKAKAEKEFEAELDAYMDEWEASLRERMEDDDEPDED